MHRTNKSLSSAGVNAFLSFEKIARCDGYGVTRGRPVELGSEFAHRSRIRMQPDCLRSCQSGNRRERVRLRTRAGERRHLSSEACGSAFAPFSISKRTLCLSLHDSSPVTKALLIGPSPGTAQLEVAQPQQTARFRSKHCAMIYVRVCLCAFTALLRHGCRCRSPGPCRIQSALAGDTTRIRGA